MNYYNALVPGELVEKLYKSGCPIAERYERDGEVFYSDTFYADVFDGLIEKGLSVEVQRGQGKWFAIVVNIESGKWQLIPRKGITTWHEMANAAIEKAIEILKEKGAEESAPRK